MKTRSLLVIALIFSAATFAITQPATAQSSSCTNTNFPNGSWTVTQGNIVGADQLWATDGTYQGISQKYAIATLSTSGKIASVAFALNYQGMGDENLATAVIELDDGSGNPIDSSVKYIGFPQNFSTGLNWTDYTAVFSPSIDTQQIKIIIYHSELGSNPYNNLGITVRSFCVDPSQPLNSPTPTLTPTPTLSPTPSHTPSPTLTFTPSNTPTPNLTTTETPTPTGTLPTIPPGTGTTGALQGGNVGTIEGPGSCDLDSTNPCGKLPFQAPSFSTLSLPSPTYIISPTPEGTPLTTATLGPVPGTIIAIATNIVVSDSQVKSLGTLTISDAQGTPISVQDAANQVGSSVGMFFGVARQVANFSLGKSGVIFGFLLLLTALTILIRIAVAIIKLIKALLKAIRTILTGGLAGT